MIYRATIPLPLTAIGCLVIAASFGLLLVPPPGGSATEDLLAGGTDADWDGYESGRDSRESSPRDGPARENGSNRSSAENGSNRSSAGGQRP